MSQAKKRRIYPVGNLAGVKKMRLNWIPLAACFGPWREQSLRRRLLAASFVAMLAACGGGGGGGSSAPAPTANAMVVSVDAGPPGTGYNVNRLYASVTICRPGSDAACQTIDHILVDTGSTGLRVLASALDPALNLPKVAAPSGFPLLNCARFVDTTFAWGPVAKADIQLGGRTAANAPFQIIADPAYNAVAGNCSTGRAVNSVAVLGAKGILGLGLLKEDCGATCAANPFKGYYFACANSVCSAVLGTTLATANQIRNPVLSFPSDNNGVVIDLPAIAGASASSLSGFVYFGIGTQANNQFGGSTVLATNPLGYFSSQFGGKTLGTSFLDTGSNGLYFDTTIAGLTACSGGTGFFYCPAASTPLSATLTGVNGQSVLLRFTVDNALGLFTTAPNAVLPTLAGNIGDPQTFDWGLPFFYGRRVFFGIEGQTTPIGTGPFYAF